ncbi:hypothetical protein NKH77_30660 [Streptomyces sp. M19]
MPDAYVGARCRSPPTCPSSARPSASPASSWSPWSRSLVRRDLGPGPGRPRRPHHDRRERRRPAPAPRARAQRRPAARLVLGGQAGYLLVPIAAAGYADDPRTPSAPPSPTP